MPGAGKTKLTANVGRRDMKTLPEFGVTLTRLNKGQRAYPVDDDEMGELGMRTKLGGEPEWAQGDDMPCCERCKKEMTFVAQIDSVEHQSTKNPHGVQAGSDAQKWMFGDVGMIYVFFCFDCLEAKSVFQGG